MVWQAPSAYADNVFERGDETRMFMTSGAETTDFDVLIVGAGISGIGAAYQMKKSVPGA